MVKVERSTVIDAPIESVWALLRDFNGHDHWHPAVASSVLEAGRRTDQVGAVRNFRLTGGERLREQLLSMSDRHHRFRYAIVDSDVPLSNYVAEVSLKPVTDGNRTFWSWRSRFNTPPGQEQSLSRLVAEGVYEAGFNAVRERVERPSPRSRPLAAARGHVSSPVRGAIDGSAIVIDRYGDADELREAATSAPPPGPGEVRIRQNAIGVNFIDVYCRTGYFKLLEPPGVPGMEAAGEVIDTGANVHHLARGQRVAYACPPVGAYASVRTMNADLVVPLPDGISDITAAAGLLKGMTAAFLLHTVHPLKAQETALIFAPAGGVGRLLVQWASHIGATVIGATSSEQKARLAKDAGADHVILPGEASLEAQVRELTDGRGADVIYDAVGRDSFAHSVAALAPCGHLVSYGQASGDIGAYDIGSLAAASATLSRPNYGHYTDTPEKVSALTRRLFDVIERGVVRIEAHHRFALREAAEAHRALEGRRTTGSIVLIPEENR